ncbi:vWA domain-containing protein [Novipirellula caenicola]|uniref:VWFA domain-containing protein n=1 Tax=Novipirellula caenicola TaxID=1536901 RepID=A0ABP9VRE3_9BACT
MSSLSNHSSSTTSSSRVKRGAERVILVSNGLEFFLIPKTEFANLEAEGFYRPTDRGMTVIQKDDKLYELPIAQAERLLAEGGRDLLSRERSKPASLPPVPLPPASKSSSAESTLAASKKLNDPQTPTSPSQDTASSDITITADSANGSGVIVAESVSVPQLDPTTVLEELNHAEQLAEQVRLEQAARLAEETGWRKYALMLQFWLEARKAKLVRQLSGSGISIAVHVAILLLLASMFLVTEQPENLVIMASPSNNDSVVEEVIVDVQPLEIVEPTETSEPEPAPAADAAEAAEPIDSPDFLANVSGLAIKPPAAPAKAAAEDASGMAKTAAKPTVFGSKFSATNYVFVIDNSNSMTKGRFETALIQLMLTVNQLTPKQRFYVIFYSDTAYGMMHPNTVPNLVPATQRNKNMLGQWLQTVPLCLQTRGKKAIQAAIDLNPDVIYILGDGAFTDGADDYFTKNPHDRIVIHTRGMEVDNKNAASFQKLAKAHRGDYKDVGVMPEGAMMAQKYPRPRNSVRGPIWGITLPLKKK